MNRTLVMLFILGASFAGKAQDKNFDLSKYKFPDYKRHELEFNFNSDGDSRKMSHEVPSPTGDGTTVRNDYSNSNFYSNFSLEYQYNYLTRKRIDYLNSNLSGKYDYTMRKNDGTQSKEFDPGIDLNLNGFRRYYLKENKFFLEGMTDLQYHYAEMKVTYPNTNYSDD